MKQVFTSSIGLKVGMALSALFLIIFLLQHFAINLTSVFSSRIFNEISHFMGTNAAVQFILQPILLIGVLYHFIMGFILEIKNWFARPKKYVIYKGRANASWYSQNMIYSGLFILFFLGFHFYDFWIPEINYKYIERMPADSQRYYDEVVHMFENPIRVIIYSLSFVFLSFHLLHGFQSAFQSLGLRHQKYTPIIQKIGYVYAISIPIGFIFIALYHYLN